jgi:tRNA A-37 threonylcarbamoyl transferase component Bud32
VPSIISCPKCAAIVVPQESGGICPQCRTPVTSDDVVTAPDNRSDATRLAESSGSGPRKSGSSRSGSSSSPGWLSTSDAIDHGRFPPGTLLGGRYRIVGRLGKGEMGEVYRADDLKLGQVVALKFLPPDVDRDAARLTQLHSEVRMARQVSHPNVCRVYDIDEVEGHTFLSMEYVDGEDLASLLRRIGRFPEDRALAIARQMCAGLAAAHERGVIHRDFKPANVMLDAAGKVRITDFGLAGAAGEAIRAGTPAYMAPEQLAGAEVTARSDIYALGLVLYEVFTGQRALEGSNLAELIRKREQSEMAPPSAIVRDLNPEIDQAIMRCLRPDVANRPPSALAVAASLPGGDPLAAALAAGETPSPEMVAAAGSSEAISIRWAAAAITWLMVTLGAMVLIDQRILLINRVPLPKSTDALVDRAQEALVTLGYTAPSRASAWGFGVSLDYPRYIEDTSTARDRWQKLAVERPESVILWYRTSPRPLIPFGNENNVAATNPPLNVSGMALVVVDASGRLSEFHAVPEPSESDEPHSAANWAALFTAAGMEITVFTPVKPRWVPLVYADERMAWEGKLPNQPDITIRIDAAAYHGRPVFFSVTGPWSRSTRSQPSAGSLFAQVVDSIADVMMPALIVSGAILARRNVRLGRGDRVGAFRAASIVFAMSLAGWILGSTHVSDFGVETTRIFAAVGSALFNGAVLWMTYLGLEPYVRRSSPDSLIGWTRLIGGNWRDPHVGKDVLVGISAGLAMTLLFALYYLLPPLLGWLEPMPVISDLRPFSGLRHLLSHLLGQVTSAFTSGMLGTVGIAALLILLKRTWLAVVATVIWFTPVVVQGMFNPGYPVFQIVLGVAIISIFIGVVIRFGLLAAIAALATHFILLSAPLTADFNTWRGPVSLWHVAVIAAAGAFACYAARSASLVRPMRRSAATQHRPSQ